MQNCIMFVINGEIGDAHDFDLDLNEIPEVEPIEMDETNDELLNQRFIEIRNLFDSLTKMSYELNNGCE